MTASSGLRYFLNIEAPSPTAVHLPKAKNAMYLIDANTGLLLGNSWAHRVRRFPAALVRSGCAIIGDVAGTTARMPQVDPAAAGESGSVVVSKAYSATSTKYWSSVHLRGSITVNEMVDTTQPIYASSALLFVGTADVYMFFATGSDLLASSTPGGADTFKLYGLKDNSPGAGATTKFAVDLAKVTNSGGLATGERPSTSPSVAGDIVFYTTTTETASTPCADFSANLYALTYAGGAAYDTNNNGKVENNESPIAKTMGGRATAPFIVDQHLYTATSGTARVEAFGDPRLHNGIGQVACIRRGGKSIVANPIICEKCGAKVGPVATGVPRVPHGAGSARGGQSRKLSKSRRPSSVFRAGARALAAARSGVNGDVEAGGRPRQRQVTDKRAPSSTAQIGRDRPFRCRGRRCGGHETGDFATSLAKFQAAIERNPQDTDSLSNPDKSW
jgi:hypothetical protein